MSADRRGEIELSYGAVALLTEEGGGGGVVRAPEREMARGPSPVANPYPDPATAELARFVRWWERFDKLQRGMQTANQPEAMTEGVQKITRSYQRQVQKALEAHPLYPWLEPMQGLRGPYTAWIIARIRDPRRFPGQKCEAGHHMPAIHEAGSSCLANVATPGSDPEPCGAAMLDPRPHTGVRSLWHYFGLHVVDGKRARRQKGKKADWVTEAGGILLGPTGIASQIERHGPEPYRGIYDQHKERIQMARGVADEVDGLVGEGGPSRANSNGAGAVGRLGIVFENGLRPFEVRTRARTIAVKAFVGDLLMEWKRLLG